MNIKSRLKELNSKIFDGLISDPELEERIAKVAYFKAKQRGFTPGHELDDWLLAEREIMLSECSDCYSQEKENDKAPPKAA